MPKIEQSPNGNILIDNRPYSRGTLTLSVNADYTRLAIYHERYKKDIVSSLPFNEYTDDSDTPFASYQDLIDYLDGFFFRVSGGTGGSSIVKSSTPPGDTSLLWFKTGDSEIYFYDGSDWVTSQIYEFVFNDQGSTPNNTWLRMGNTVSNNLGIGFYLDYDVKITGLSFNRAPNTTQVGFYDLYSNTLNISSDTAAVVGSYLTDSSARGFIEFPQQSPSSLLELNAGCYISLRWRGNQTNNNVTNIQYRKKHI